MEKDLNPGKNPKKLCPKCGKKEGVKIVYGFPSSELWEEAQRREIYLGGCVIGGQKWHCYNCGNEW